MNPSSLSRRGFLNRFLYGAASLPLMEQAWGALSEIKIKRVRFYRSRISPPSFNQSFHVVTLWRRIKASLGLVGEK
ncbi:hypothetical protein N8737_02250 [Verrucomicrobia bacterium]|nr:hypothetical protein [Verrucomicrobiota bacterium]